MEKKQAPSCDSCINYEYDEEYGVYCCSLYLDEDELLRYSYNPNRRCPFYQYRDEYINVRKQI